jgi:hypothetical protein
MGTHAVTQALVVTDVARRVHHDRFVRRDNPVERRR